MKPSITALAALLVASCAVVTGTRQQPGSSDHHSHRAEHAVGVHGMLVVGESDIYMSHLPIFHMPHAFQVILAVRLPGRARATYLEDRASSGETVYTFVPQVFDLTEAQGARKVLRGDLYRGHFERGGKRIATGVDVEIERVVHYRRLDPATPRPAMPSYVAFGDADEGYLAHWISGRPDFDQIVRIERTSGSDLAEGVVVTLAAGDAPLTAGAMLTSQGPAGKTSVRVTSVLYTETGDLEH